MDTLKTIIATIKISVLSKNTSNADKVDLPQPLVPHNSTVTDSFLSRILHRENIIIARKYYHCIEKISGIAHCKEKEKYIYIYILFKRKLISIQPVFKDPILR